MIKNLINELSVKRSTKKQEKLVDYISDVSTIDRAVKGSMKKRNSLIERVSAKLKHA